MRVVIGVVAMLTIFVAFGRVLNLGFTAAATAAYASPQFANALLGLFAAACGGFIARRGYFAPIAMAAHTPLCVLSIYYVHRFRPDLTYADLVSSNAVPIAILLAAVGIGALFGYNLCRIGKAHRAAA